MNILITGTSRGIGRATALKFLKEGHKVIGFDIREDSISGTIKNQKNYTVRIVSLIFFEYNKYILSNLWFYFISLGKF